MNRAKQVFGLFAWLALSFTAAAVGAIASIHARDFYSLLSRPSWAPPGWVFGPVWTMLYLMMGCAVWLVWRDGGWRQQGRALWIFMAQLIANGLWSWLFFAWHLGAVATVGIVVLWLLVIWTTVEFWRRQRIAGVLLMPYLGWVSFASALCFFIWRMNPSLL